MLAYLDPARRGLVRLVRQEIAIAVHIHGVKEGCMSVTFSDIPGRLASRGHYTVVRRLEGGHRNLSFLVRDKAGTEFVAKTSRRCQQSVAWVVRLQREATKVGLNAPLYLQAPGGSYITGDMTLELMAHGRPATDGELSLVRPAMAVLRRATKNFDQRPGFRSAAQLLSESRSGDVDLGDMPANIVRACRMAWAPLKGRQEVAVHGDLNSTNLLIGPDGRPILIDWDEARRDAAVFDLAPFRPSAGRMAIARLAWEVAAGWRIEPIYAKALAVRLLQVTSGLKLNASKSKRQ